MLVKSGISEKQIEQLIKYSHEDELIVKYTKDSKRFKNRKSFNKWMDKERDVLVLTNEKDDLLGIIWTGEKRIPVKKMKGEYRETFAIRMYGEARGKGLALEFMKKCIKTNGYWLEVDKENTAAIKLYEKFGFKKIGKSRERKDVMVY